MGEKIKQYRTIDAETGEIELDISRRVNPNQLGKDWCAMYQFRIQVMIDEFPTLTTWKVFMYLASKLNYEDIYETTKREVSEGIGVNYKDTLKAMNWLIDNDYIQVVKNRKDLFEFSLNPDVVMKGNKKYEQLKRWEYRKQLKMTEETGKTVYLDKVRK